MLYIYFNYSSLHQLRQAILVSFMVNGGLVLLRTRREKGGNQVVMLTGEQIAFYHENGYLGVETYCRHRR